MFTYATVCLLVRSCCLTQRYQSKSLDEISPNPIVPRDRQSTLRFEKSISAVWKKKSWSQTKVVGINTGKANRRSNEVTKNSYYMYLHTLIKQTIF